MLRRRPMDQRPPTGQIKYQRLRIERDFEPPLAAQVLHDVARQPGKHTRERRPDQNTQGPVAADQGSDGKPGGSPGREQENDGYDEREPARGEWHPERYVQL